MIDSETTASCRAYASKWQVSPVVHPDDFIFQFLLNHASFQRAEQAVAHYFDDGRNSAELLREILARDLLIDPDTPRQMLEFACGYGAVTRHLLKVLPALEITSCDIHAQANAFIVRELNGKAIGSSAFPAKFDPGQEFDVVFALSFFSHMPKRTWAAWLSALYKILRPGGYLIFTTHGLTSKRKLGLAISLDSDGFFFSPHSEQGDLDATEYGTTVVSPGFVVGQVAILPDIELCQVRCGLWWTHQDLYALTKLPGS